ncbi:hypothetical protein HK097_007623 [Rhizophlyctis rosea]|uniref:Uncharacterized protein n=1 Tax=Rhizophlyctis rosea TaxID=64517 RepID=A0AAD5X4G7_9FUNG|nr:hypothetical protein HK097_007623 [Rhizophlyctis rosea]
MTIHHDPAGAKHTAAKTARRNMAITIYESFYGEQPPSDSWGVKVPPESRMQIHVRTATGNTRDFIVKATDSVQGLKFANFVKERIQLGIRG